MARREPQWLQQFVCKEDTPEDGDRYSSFEPRRSRSPSIRSSKSADDIGRLRKLTSLSYLVGKLRDIFHREHRDTIVCEEDEESPASKRNINDIIRRNEDLDLNFNEFSHSVSLPEQSHKTPSKEQRWCTNCSKCFQRGLSKFDQYCGLDCKTAHRLRQSAPHYQYTAQSPSMVSEETLAVRAAATRPPPHFTTYSVRRRG